MLEHDSFFCLLRGGFFRKPLTFIGKLHKDFGYGEEQLSELDVKKARRERDKFVDIRVNPMIAEVLALGGETFIPTEIEHAITSRKRIDYVEFGSLQYLTGSEWFFKERYFYPKTVPKDDSFSALANSYRNIAFHVNRHDKFWECRDKLAQSDGETDRSRKMRILKKQIQKNLENLRVEYQQVKKSTTFPMDEHLQAKAESLTAESHRLLEELDNEKGKKMGKRLKLH